MDLETRALKQFDNLVKTGELFWKENDVRVVPAEPFNASNVSSNLHYI
jgi:hypothetical protein